MENYLLFTDPLETQGIALQTVRLQGFWILYYFTVLLSIRVGVSVPATIV